MGGVWTALSIDPKSLKGECSSHCGALAVRAAGVTAAAVVTTKHGNNKVDLAASVGN